MHTDERSLHSHNRAKNSHDRVMVPPADKAPDRGALLPAAGLPLLYFGFAHVCLALACALLVREPGLPGAFFLHPRMVAVVHLVTLGWISGSILGAFYIVGPLALRLSLRPGWLDRMAFGCFALGVTGLVGRFWAGDYPRIGWVAVLAIAAVLQVAVRAWAGLWRSVVPWPVKLHVGLAFLNMLAASLFGLLIGLNRVFGWYAWSPVSAAWAHAHVAAIGWAAMMVVGIGYRLIPMILPAAMPARPTMAASAVLLESGILVLASALVADSPWALAGGVLIVAGLASFAMHVHAMLEHRLPPPAALPRPDWATRQTHVALVCLLATAVFGLLLLLPVPPRWGVPLGWLYGTFGLAGFLSQIVVGIQGRLLPMHAWYRAFEAGGLQPPSQSAHELASQPLARLICLTWAFGVPLLACGLAWQSAPAISVGAAVLLAGVFLNVGQGTRILAAARAATRDASGRISSAP